MIDLMRELLNLREKLLAISDLAAGYGLHDEELPQIKQMQALERSCFATVTELEKPDPE